MPEGPSESLVKTVHAMMENVREMISASKLLRSRIESNDEVARLMRLRMDRIEEYQKELDRRLTKFENTHTHWAGTITTSPPITNRNRSGDT